jgi:hypothetical protein
MAGVMTLATIAAFALLMPVGTSPPSRSADPRPTPLAGDPSRTPAVGTLTARAFGSDPIADPPSAPTADAGQSKVWQHAGRWWALLLDATGTTYHIHALDLAGQEWLDTGVVADDRATSHADVLIDGDRLFIVSAGRASTPATRPQVRRFTYDQTGSWTPESGDPIDLGPLGVNSPSIARDSTGRVWVAFNDRGRVMITSSPEGAGGWTEARPIPGPGTSVVEEDVARIAAYGPGRVGVMWSNQGDGTFRFAVHRDGEPLDAWTSEVVLAGPSRADNHIDLATASIGAEERIVAVVKTSLNEMADVDRDEPLISVLTQRSGGGWAESTFGRVRDHHTRPLVLVDAPSGSVVVVATAEEVGRSITWKGTSFQNPSWDTGVGSKLIGDEDDAITDPTSTKQAVDLTTGAVVVAWDEARGRYMSGLLSLSGTASSLP